MTANQIVFYLTMLIILVFAYTIIFADQIADFLERFVKPIVEPKIKKNNK